jgi:LysR family carnitine catabolism transcriptional activator
MIYPPLSKLRTFVAVAEHKSFRKASEQLHLSQPALSLHIRDLEEALQVPLFHRTTRSVTLTSEGERFLIRAHRVLDELESAVVELQDQASRLRGRVVISCLPTIAYHVLPKAIASVAMEYPGVDIRVFDEVNAPLLRRVLSREADFGIGPRPEREDDLEFSPILTDPFVAVVPNNHPLASSPTVRLKALAKHPILTLARGTNVRSHLDRVFEGEGLELKPAHEAFHRATLCGYAQAGLGVAILPLMVQSMMESASLTTIRIIAPEIAREFGIIQRRDQAHRPVVVTFLATLERALATPSDPSPKGARGNPRKQARASRT